LDKRVASGKMQKDAFPLELAHEKQFFVVFREKRFEGEFFAGEPVYGEVQPFIGGKNGKVGFIFL
jgi:hypothetical protein